MKTGNRGLTLLELLVAFAILLMLIGALVTLTTRSLETWQQGETRKETYDRAQGVLETVARDLRNLYAENEWYDDGYKQLQPPALMCDEDRSRRQRLRFVRTGDPNVIKVGAQAPAPTQVAPMLYGEQWEIAYVMDPDPSKTVLWRGIRSYNRQPTGNLLRPSDHESLWQACFRPVESGVLHVGYRFWTQYTTTWDDAAPIQRVAPNSKGQSGPERTWDSTRKLDGKFFFHRRRPEMTNPDFVYPEIVQVTVVIETASPDQHGIRLAAVCDERATTLSLTHTRDLPDAPAMVKVEGEWIEFGGKTYTQLTNCRRGARGTQPQAHPAQAAVRFGETFTTDVRIAAYREAQQP